MNRKRTLNRVNWWNTRQYPPGKALLPGIPGRTVEHVHRWEDDGNGWEFCSGCHARRPKK